MNLVLDDAKDAQLEFFDSADVQLAVGNLLVNGFHLQRVDVFELGGDEHRSDSDDVQVGHLLSTRAVLEEPVHKGTG